MKDKYEWKWCTECHQRIFKNELEGDTIKALDGKLYCIDCAYIIERGDIYYEGKYE